MGKKGGSQKVEYTAPPTTQLAANLAQQFLVPAITPPIKSTSQQSTPQNIPTPSSSGSPIRMTLMGSSPQQPNSSLLAGKKGSNNTNNQQVVYDIPSIYDIASDFSKELDSLKTKINDTFQTNTQNLISAYDNALGNISSIMSKGEGLANSVLSQNISDINSSYDKAIEEVNKVLPTINSFVDRVKDTYTEVEQKAKDIYTSENDKSKLKLGLLGFLNTSLLQQALQENFNKILFPILTQKAAATSNALQNELTARQNLASLISSLYTNKGGALSSTRNAYLGALLPFLSSGSANIANLSVSKAKDLNANSIAQIQALADLTQQQLNASLLPFDKTLQVIGALNGVSSTYQPALQNNPGVLNSLARATGNAASTFAMASAAGMPPPVAAAMAAAAALGGKK